MKKIRTIIVEDVAQDYELLLILLRENCPEIEIIGVVKGVHSAYKLIRETKPDLVFFDIEIEEKGTSFDVIDMLLKNKVRITFETIFMTAFREYDYSTKAFEYAAIDYLTKPVEKKDLIRAVSRMENKSSMKEATDILARLLDVLKTEDSKSDYITIHMVRKKLRVIYIPDINYVKADTVLSHFHLNNGEVIVAQRNLGKYRKILEHDHHFFSISHSMTVNLDYMEEYDHSKQELKLTNGECLHASRQYGQKFNTYLKENNLIKIHTPTTAVDKIKNLLGLGD